MRQKKTPIFALIALAACQPMTAGPGQNSDTAPVPAGWTRQNLSSGYREAPGYSVALPPDLIRQSAQSIDSEVARFKGQDLEISFDYGRYGNLGTCRPRWTCRDGTSVSDGRSAWTRTIDMGEVLEDPRFGQAYAAYIRVTDDVWLAIQAQCADDAACERAATIVRSVDFTA